MNEKTANFKVDLDNGEFSGWTYAVYKKVPRLFGYCWERQCGSGSDNYDEAVNTLRKLAANPIPVYA